MKCEKVNKLMHGKILRQKDRNYFKGKLTSERIYFKNLKNSMVSKGIITGEKYHLLKKAENH